MPTESCFFGAKGVNDKERDPGWDEYSSSNRSTVESLVRESIQNSFDAETMLGLAGANPVKKLNGDTV